MTDSPTPQAPGAPEPVPTAPPTPKAAPAATPPAVKTPPWGTDENFNPATAWELIENLRKEKGADAEALKTQVASLQASTDARNKALADALGLTETPKSEDLAETVKALHNRIDTSEREATRLRIAAEKEVPAAYHYLLTETDTEKLTAQAEMAAEYARLKAQADGTPQFQPNAGQGQSGTPGTPEAIAAAEYEKFYPEKKRP